MLTPFDDPRNNECYSYVDTVTPPPVPGAVVVGRAHTHPNPEGGPIYGCDQAQLPNGDYVEGSKFPGDTANGKRPEIKNKAYFPRGGSLLDWDSMLKDLPAKPNYVIDVNGTVAEVSYYTLVNARLHNWAPSTAKRCAWVR
jgi:hypothetical protein